MPAPSVRAQLADLLGGDPREPDAARPTVGRAAQRAAPGTIVAARRGKQRVALVTLHDGRQFVVPDRCPHDDGLLSDGFLDGESLVCARHGWEFDVETGQCPGRATCLDSARLVPADKSRQ